MARLKTICDSDGLRRFDEALTALGYSSRGVPERLQAAVAIDREVCADGRCDDCNHLGLSLVAYHRANSYVAVSVCPACGAASEF